MRPEVQSMINQCDESQLLELERAMWRTETRCDLTFQEQHFAPDFIEFGQSGRTYSRAQMILSAPYPIKADLSNFHLRELGPGIVQITYDSTVMTSEGERKFAHRSSIWSKTSSGWQMRFHQGTPFQPGYAVAK